MYNYDCRRCFNHCKNFKGPSFKHFGAILILVLILAGCSNSEEVKSQKIAIAFGTDLYTVDTEEVDKYKSILNSNIYNAKELYETIQINDADFKSLMTEDAYDTLLSNRENLIFAHACYNGNYTMQVKEFKLSENKNDIENDIAEYDFQAQIKII